MTFTAKELAAHLGTSSHRVLQIATKLGIARWNRKHTRSKPFTADQAAALIAAHRSRMFRCPHKWT
jgi:hypothetical protein